MCVIVSGMSYVFAYSYIAGRKTLSQVFDEYDIAIAVSNRSRFGSSSSSDPLPLGAETDHSSPGGDSRGAQFERAVKDYVPESDSMTGRLRRAVIDYGYTVAVFHVAVSLTTFGVIYVLVARCAAYILCEVVIYSVCCC